MSYSSITDFLALLRTTSGGERVERMPGLDYVISAMTRMGLCLLWTGQTAPTSSQASTVWLRPAVPSWSAEGAIFLWNPNLSVYQAATPTLWGYFFSGAFLALIPGPATVAPLVDAGTGAAGVSLLYARQDHVHPTDTTRAAINSPVFVGNPQAPTPPFGDNSTSLATTAFVQFTSGVVVPLGGVVAYAGATAPSANWAVAQGQAVSRVTYAALFAILGITFGSGDGVTTFNLPDLRGRVVAGVDGGAGRLTTATMSSQALAGVGGAETHVLTTAEMPTHFHGAVIADAGHAHTVNPGPANLPSGSGGTNTYMQGAAVATSTATTGVTVASPNGPNTTYSSGTGGPHSIVQPTIELNYLIRVL